MKNNDSVVISYINDNERELEKKTSGAAGFDLYPSEELTIQAYSVAYIDTKIHVSIPKGMVGLIIERSSLHHKGLALINSVGVIDSDYRGSLIMPIQNNYGDATRIYKNVALAQIIFIGAPDIYLQKVEQLDDTIRGHGGFGSTD